MTTTVKQEKQFKVKQNIKANHIKVSQNLARSILLKSQLTLQQNKDGVRAKNIKRFKKILEQKSQNKSDEMEKASVEKGRKLLELLKKNQDPQNMKKLMEYLAEAEA